MDDSEGTCVEDTHREGWNASTAGTLHYLSDVAFSITNLNST